MTFIAWYEAFTVYRDANGQYVYRDSDSLSCTTHMLCVAVSNTTGEVIL